MKRAHDDRPRTLRVWRKALSKNPELPAYNRGALQPGRYRKGRRVGGCGNARCGLCHAEKLLKEPTVQERRAVVSMAEWLREV